MSRPIKLCFALFALSAISLLAHLAVSWLAPRALPWVPIEMHQRITQALLIAVGISGSPLGVLFAIENSRKAMLELTISHIEPGVTREETKLIYRSAEPVRFYWHVLVKPAIGALVFAAITTAFALNVDWVYEMLPVQGARCRLDLANWSDRSIRNMTVKLGDQDLQFTDVPITRHSAAIARYIEIGKGPVRFTVDGELADRTEFSYRQPAEQTVCVGDRWTLRVNYRQDLRYESITLEKE